MGNETFYGDALIGGSNSIFKFFEPWEWSVSNFSLYYYCFKKTEWSWELRTWSPKRNLIDPATNSPHFLYWKLIGTRNKNLIFDVRVKTFDLLASVVSPSGYHSGWDQPHFTPIYLFYTTKTNLFQRNRNCFSNSLDIRSNEDFFIAPYSAQRMPCKGRFRISIV